MTTHDYIAIAVVFVLTSVLSGMLQGIWPVRDPNAERLARLEGKINRILEHLGVEQAPALDKFQELIMTGHKLQAIKLYREQTGVSILAPKKTGNFIDSYVNGSTSGPTPRYTGRPLSFVSARSRELCSQVPPVSATVGPLGEAGE